MEVQSSYIYIRNLRLYASHGVMPQERRVGAWFTLSLRVHYNITRAIETDCVADTLNYADLCRLAEEQMQQPSMLLEHVAGRIGRAVLERYQEATGVDVWLTKNNPPMGADCDGAGVELHLINNKTKV